MHCIQLGRHRRASHSPERMTLDDISYLKSNSKRVVLDPHGEFLQRWNKILLVSYTFTMAWDALFFYIPVIKANNNCVKSDYPLEVITCTVRTCADLFYLVHIILKFRTGYISPTSRGFGRGELVKDRRLIATRYLKSFFIVDVLAVLPFPQIVVLGTGVGRHGFTTQAWLKLAIFLQYIPRLFQIYPIYKEVTRTSGVITELAWLGAALNLLLYLLASHVLGAVWYLFSIDRIVRCWHESCIGPGCRYASFYCNNKYQGNYTINTAYCSFVDPDQITNSTVYDFGMFYDALHSKMVQSRTFCQKLSYCFWWGLRNLSSFGSNLKSSKHIEENLLAALICVSGLILFSFLFGNIMKYIDSTTIRIEEMRLRRRDSEKWMSHRSLPEELRKKIRKYEQYKWQETRGVDEETVINKFPRDLRTEIKRHLWDVCFHHIMRVPWLSGLDEEVLDAMCDWIKPVLYMENSFIIREGQPIKEILFIMRGKLISTKAASRKHFFYRVGDFSGEELFTWSVSPRSKLPIATWTLKTVTEVEAFALRPDDILLLVPHLRRLHGDRLRLVFRFYSQQWRQWAVSVIQAAWRHHRRQKLKIDLGNAENAQATTGRRASPRLSTTIYASRFAANALQNLRRNNSQHARTPAPSLTKCNGI